MGDRAASRAAPMPSPCRVTARDGTLPGRSRWSAMTAETELRDALFAIEEGFWLGGKEHFLEHVDERCMLAFPQMGEMHGVRSRDEVAATVSTQPGRWRDLNISDRHLLRPTADTAIISYRADVKRFDDESYAAIVSSAYVRRDGGWKLAFHQHSPV